MAAPLPSEFTDIPIAKCMNGATVNVIGIVTDTLPPKKTGGSSSVATFTLKTSGFAGPYYDGLKIKYFHNDEQYIPAPQVGDVVIIRSLKVLTLAL